MKLSRAVLFLTSFALLPHVVVPTADSASLLELPETTTHKEHRRMSTVLGCPLEHLQDLFDNFLFRVTTDEEVSCTSTEVETLNKFFDNTAGSVLSVDALRKSGFSDRAFARISHCPNNKDDVDRRNLSILGFRIYLYRSMGRCYFCSADDWDVRRLRGRTSLMLEPSMTVPDILSTTEDPINKRVVEMLPGFVGAKPGSCFHGANLSIDVKLVPTQTEGCVDADSGGAFTCCTPVGTPDNVCGNTGFDNPVFCHSTADACESKACNGLWTDLRD